MRHVTVMLLAALFASTFVGDATAEVRVKTDDEGRYRSTQVLVGGPRWNPRVWSVVSRFGAKQALNPDGDLNGDLWPTIVESNLNPHHPWVVWSQRRGAYYDLAWSRWNSGSWEPVRPLHDVPDRGDDLDADVTFDANGRAHVVWWRDRGGHGRVFLSLFLVNEWMAPYPISQPAVDSRYPTVQVLEGGTIRVEYETAAGTVSQNIVFDEPVTITDDINPLDHLRHDGEPVVIGVNP